MVPSVRYPLHQRRLDNGLRVVINPDPAVPAVAVNLWYDVGSRHEEPGRSGFAHLFEHLMFQGSAHVGSGKHISMLQAAGASVNATTWFDRTNYFEALPVGGLDLALWLEADRLSTLLEAVTQENLDNQREVVKEEKRQRYDNVPYGLMMQFLVQNTFPADHPYGHTTIGSMEDLDAAELADVHAFFRRHYMPNNAVLTIAGGIEVDDAMTRVERYFGQIPAGELPETPKTPPLPALSGVPRTEVRAPVPADALYLSWRLPALDQRSFDAADLGLSILGDGQTSRLYRRLVREDQLTTGAGASALGLIGGNSFGFASARARESVDIAQVEEIMISEIERFAAEGPTDEELLRAKAQYERQWLSALATLATRADQISSAATLLDDPEEINQRLITIDGIDTAEITAAVAEHLTADARAAVVYRAIGEDDPVTVTSERLPS
ncbi:M16 family metallopeptidase [Naumannella halotolerans]|uniref:M16 family metallopeptidase n=1 Tax=Naumannella halotolerans TaxID=993414 RepID=UPI00370D2F82